MKMLRKFFILAFLSASFTVWATPCSTVFPQLQPIPDSVMKCRLDTLRFEPQASLMYLWSDSSRNPYFVIRDAGEIWVKITDSAGINTCRDTIQIHLFPIPEITSPIRDTILCSGDTLPLKIGEISDVYGFQWEVRIGFSTYTFLDTTLKIIFDSVVIFDTLEIDARHLNFVAVYRGYCAVNRNDLANWEQYTVRDTASVFFARPPEINFGFSDTTVCFDFDIEGFELTALSPQFDITQYGFRWIWDNQDRGNQNTFIVPYDARGNQVIVNVWNEFCWDDRDNVEGYFITDTVIVDFWPRAWREPILPEDTSLVCRGQRITLDASVPFPLTTYHWEHDAITDPIRVFEAPGDFTVVLTDSAGCQRSFTIGISEDIQVIDWESHMPNVFTPNNDTQNDVFELINPQQLDQRLNSFHLRIYNRWGRVVWQFEGQPSEVNWDPGTSYPPDGTYFWGVNAVDECRAAHRARGTVTILR